MEYQPGSKEDFDRLYQASYQRIFRTLATILGDAAAAEDCTQDAFLKAYRAWPRWKGDSPAEAWVHRIAINTALSFIRKRRLREVGELIRRLGRPIAPGTFGENLTLRGVAVSNRLYLERVQLAEVGDLVERQGSVFDQPHGGCFRHQGRGRHW